jgi:hypothetical protein
VACWGISSPAGLQCVNVPDEAFFELACGENHSVAKTANGELMCWGWDSHDQLVPPGGSFSSITSGWWHSIGLRPNGELVQWGWSGPGGSLEDPPAGRYLAVAAGHYHSVGIVDTSEPCAEDLNDDQSVDFADLIVVISGWGPCGSPCDEDLNQDGSVGFQDLSQILSAWGTCTD